MTKSNLTGENNIKNNYNKIKYDEFERLNSKTAMFFMDIFHEFNWYTHPPTNLN